MGHDELSIALRDSDALHVRVRAMVRAFVEHSPAVESFDAVGRDLVRFQYRNSAVHQRLAHATGLTESELQADSAPAVLTEIWKRKRMAWFPENMDERVFCTSGTTEGQLRGMHAFRTLESYAAGALAMGRYGLLSDLSADLAADPEVLVLGPSPQEQPNSSLTFMNDVFVRALRIKPEATASQPHPGSAFFLADGVFDLAALDERIAAAQVHGRPVLLLATSFALVQLLDALGPHDVFSLPPKSRVMQTGGFKGKSREVSAPELRREVSRIFSIPESHIVSEYGMTELSSQFYEASIAEPSAPPGMYLEPPWARIVVVDPVTFLEVPFGEVGVARIEDLLNVDSAFAVLTQDRVRRLRGGSEGRLSGFELLGRDVNAPLRGCSLSTEELMLNASN